MMRSYVFNCDGISTFDKNINYMPVLNMHVPYSPMFSFVQTESDTVNMHLMYKKS